MMIEGRNNPYVQAPQGLFLLRALFNKTALADM